MSNTTGSIATLATPARHELVVKHSRFVADAEPVESVDDAMSVLAEARRTDATHHCWAYRIGDAYRSSDDGEPAGTAGRPILAAIDGQAFDRIVVVVTRWYGGINLGAGGLVRAYGGCAAECLRTASRRELVAMRMVEVSFGFEDTGAVRGVLEGFDARTEAQGFDARGTRMRLQLPADCVDTLKTRLRDATRDRACVSLDDTPSPHTPA